MSTAENVVEYIQSSKFSVGSPQFGSCSSKLAGANDGLVHRVGEFVLGHGHDVRRYALHGDSRQQNNPKHVRDRLRSKDTNFSAESSRTLQKDGVVLCNWLCG